MSDIILTKSQGRAVREIKNWFRHETDHQQVFRLFGYAGTGKTTIIKYIVEDLGLNEHSVAFASFTGKAAHVMRRNGLPATTIHSLIYLVRMASVEEIEKEEELLKQMREDKASPKSIAEQMKRVSNLKKPLFRLNEESAAGTVRLIVLDEVSMVGGRLAEDLLSFGTPILVVGDPGQLPPIEGPGFFTAKKPDVMLTRIHRQAADSPIIRLATMAREGQFIPYGKHGKGVRKTEGINKNATYLKHDQVICGKNITRRELNKLMRREEGLKGPIPTGANEKIICLTNDHEIGLINGMFLRLRNVEEKGTYWITADVFDDDTGEEIPVSSPIYAGNFRDHFKFDKNRLENDWKYRLGYIDATYGWAITCHKSQGSQYGSVLLIDESNVWRGKERRQWLYTGITRAERRLTIVS